MNMNEDFERESQKDSIYLLEEQKLLEEQIMREIATEEMKEAKIIILKEIPKKDEDKSQILPF